MNCDKLLVKRFNESDFIIHYVCDLRAQNDRMQFVKQDQSGKPENPDEMPAICRIGRAHAILDMMASGTYTSRRNVAEALKTTTATISRILNYAFISPEIIERFLGGEISSADLTKVASQVHMVPFWADQHRLIGIS